MALQLPRQGDVSEFYKYNFGTLPDRGDAAIANSTYSPIGELLCDGWGYFVPQTESLSK